jgi:4-hydroxybenzoate polyprenyltransferase
VNDVYDYETDRRNPRKLTDGIEGGVLHPVHHKDVLVASYISTILILLSGFATQHRDNILAAILVVTIAWQYSSPPLRIKEIPVLDSLSNGCLVSLIWFFGYSHSGSSFSELPLRPIMNHLCAAAGHALGAVVDYEADVAVGQRTIATALGRRPVAFFAAVC